MAVVDKLAHLPPPKPTSLIREALHALIRFWWIAVILFGIRLLYKRYASPLRKYPGPWLASVSRLWKVIATASGKNEEWFIDLHRKYGPVVRFAPDSLAFARPQAAREILTAGKGFDKTDFYGVFPPPENPDIFTEPREKVHAQKKRVASGPYSMKSMLEQAPVIDEIIQLFFRQMDDRYINHPNKVFDLGDWLHYFAFDVLGMIAFSRQFGFLETGTDVENAIKTIDDSQWYNGIVGQVPEFDHLLRRNPLWNYVPFLSTKNALITRYALAEMEKRKPFGSAKAHANEKNDLMGMLIKGHEQSPERFGEGDVFAVAHGAIFAGSDSTASTMQSMFYHVLRDPRVYSKLLAEIDEAFDSSRVSRPVQYGEAITQLPYFQACLKEAMRVRPAVGLNIERQVPPGGAEIDGQWYPGGVRVAVNGWVLHRDQEVFGPDVETYRPERWTESEEKAKFMDKYMCQFGGGSHLCLGKNLALLEINKVCPLLLRDYHFQLVDPNQKLEHRTTFFVVQHGLKVYVTKRHDH